MSNTKVQHQTQKRFGGISASPGIAIGAVVKYASEKVVILRLPIQPEDVENEIQRLARALRRTKRDLRSIKQMISNRIGENYADLVDAQLLSLEDESVLSQVRERIRNNMENAEYAFQQVLSDYRQQLEESENLYMRERASDVYDVKLRVLRHLLASEHMLLEDMEEPAILVAQELRLSDMIMMDRSKIKGMISESGGRTSHVAILARALQIPAVVGVHDIMEAIDEESTIIIDGSHGAVIINPDQETLEHFEGEQEHIKEIEQSLYAHKELPAETQDGYRIVLSSNIGLPGELDNVVASGSEGIGLYRTEYLYLVKNTFPTEEEQFQEYKHIAEACHPDPVIFRTFDLGGDKVSGIPGYPYLSGQSKII